MKKYKNIKHCRISDSTNLKEIVSLGNLKLTGVFPNSLNQAIGDGPLTLVWCEDSGLVQLKQTYNLDEMYGDNYGYRSSLNTSMIKHLDRKASLLMHKCNLREGDIVIDIGSNDATFLKNFCNKKIKLIGIDPSGSKLIEYYPDEIRLIPEFFPSKTYAEDYNGQKVKLITSIAMFYDLESPNDFVENISKILDINGIWHFEQSYLPKMIEMNSYDTICHEHLEYYTLGVIKKMLENFNLKIVDVEFNDINGGSFAISAARKENMSYVINSEKIEKIIQQEKSLGFDTADPYIKFSDNIKKHKNDLLKLLNDLKKDGKKVIGYGASTKGNVLLQYCGITNDLLPFIAEVNQDKFGHFTPGSNIPIISEEEAHSLKPDYFLVLPWHFKRGIIKKESSFLNSGGKFIFPLPQIEIV